MHMIVVSSFKTWGTEPGVLGLDTTQIVNFVKYLKNL